GGSPRILAWLLDVDRGRPPHSLPVDLGRVRLLYTAGATLWRSVPCGHRRRRRSALRGLPSTADRRLGARRRASDPRPRSDRTRPLLGTLRVSRRRECGRGHLNAIHSSSGARASDASRCAGPVLALVRRPLPSREKVRRHRLPDVLIRAVAGRGVAGAAARPRGGARAAVGVVGGVLVLCLSAP